MDGGVDVQIHIFLTPALVECEFVSFMPQPFYSRERDSGANQCDDMKPVEPNHKLFLHLPILWKVQWS
jgi:hypothetical protein